MQLSVVKLVLASVVLAVAACGSGQKQADAPRSSDEKDAPTGTSGAWPASSSPPAEAPPVDAGASSADGGAGPTADRGGRPFAGSAAEATQLITEALDKKQSALAKCVKEFRVRAHLAHEKVSVGIGIDQEGRVIGVTLPKGKHDKELTACVQQELRDVAFPRSHAGVITITRSFEERVQ